MQHQDINLFQQMQQWIVAFCHKYHLKIHHPVRVTTAPINHAGDISSTFLLPILAQANEQLLTKWTQKLHLYFYALGVSKIQIVAPGFVNFFLSSKLLFSELSSIVTRKTNYFRAFFSPKNRHVVYQLEMVSANPTGDLHIGHIRNGIIGDSLARVLGFARYRVIRQYWVNDAGQQVVNCAFTIFWHYLDLQKKISFALPDRCYHGEVYRSLAQAILKEKKNCYAHVLIHPDGSVDNLEALRYFEDYAVRYFMQRIKNNLKKINITVDEYREESTFKTAAVQAKWKLFFQKKKLIYQKEGAWWFRTQHLGDEKDRVLIKSTGVSTYFFPDIIGHQTRFIRFQDDETVRENWILDVWGSDHHNYAVRLKIALAQLPGVDIKYFHILMSSMITLIRDHQVLKISKRSGVGIWFADLYDAWGSDLMRFILVNQKPTKHLKINFNEVITNSQQNPYFYCQYALVRASSILVKAQRYSQFPQQDTDWQLVGSEQLILPREKRIMLKLSNFIMVVQQIVVTKHPHLLVEYLLQLATLFHEYYTHHTFLDVKNWSLSIQRLKLVSGVKVMIMMVFDLLGIKPKYKI